MKLTNLKSLILGLCILAASTVKAQLFDYKNPVPYKASATVKKINNVGVAIASKDGSSAYASNCKIENFKLSAFMTYVKKNNYSSPSLSLKNCLTANQIFEEVLKL